MMMVVSIMWITTITVTISALASYRHEGAATSAMALRSKNWECGG